MPFLFRSQENCHLLGAKQALGRSFYFQHHLDFIKNSLVCYMLWWQSILCYWYSELLEVASKSFVSFLHCLRMIVLTLSMLSWLTFACFPPLFWECIQIVFLCRKGRHFTTPWSKCDVLIRAQPVSSDKTFSPWVMRRSRLYMFWNLTYLFLLLKFD